MFLFGDHLTPLNKIDSSAGLGVGVPDNETWVGFPAQGDGEMGTLEREL